MQQVTRFDANHEDLVHDIAYDFYGRRLVSCSSDQKLKVWDFDEDAGWELNDSWKAHDCSVLKVCWGHPEYGQVIASCSFDRSVRIWEEQDHEPRNSGRRWVERARLVDSRGSVQDIEFAPHHHGLWMATCAADGTVRIYEAMEVVNLSHWTLTEEFEVSVGGAGKEAEGNYCLSWCPSKFQQPQLAVGCGRDHTCKIFRMDQHGKWQAREELFGHEGVVHDVAWAPNVGRSYHLIATACKDHRVRIFKLTENPGDNERRYKVEMVANFVDHNAEVWRVEWNITGTILSTSGDDGKVRLWKATYADEWKCMSIISAEHGGDRMER
ncbi:WD40-repeat-containing domain protein [Thamnocephalis sphaerospora]|uniref:WD40-repeat-containing domain protein n=1 Tax=Thamnocephalis sphaerospora TaxID=78915 RepID=A0A4P9XN97_9FUNG|nr:WD40-repeat-containing domain protein [Thamnocephalis sphaerospora]|eukprot:RKP07427.1 WD40-repeat-containing domain protein [Thamnocephalis sphaerospora]